MSRSLLTGRAIWCSALVAAAACALPLTGCGDVRAPTAASLDALGKTPAEDGSIVVPNGSNAELLQFIEQLQRRQPRTSSPEQKAADLRQTARAIIGAADKILASQQPDEPTRVAALNARLRALVRIADPGTPGSMEEVRKAAEAAAQEKDESLVMFARSALVALYKFSIQQGSDAEAPALLEQVKQLVSGNNLKQQQFALALDAIQVGGLELADPAELAKQAYAAVLAACDRVNLAELPENRRQAMRELLDEVREICQAGVRRLSHVGQPIQIEGTLVDGTRFDWSRYRGKVVLVDFWATWCVPCVKELPNVKENYAHYHEQGFDVVGVSFDENRLEVEQFLLSQKVTWATLFSDDPKEQGWANPMKTRYDISALPTTFLVNRDGILVSVAARGPRLAKHLERLLGKPTDRSPDGRPLNKLGVSAHIITHH